MRIKVEHIPNTYNYGSLMMAINTLSYVGELIEDVSFFVDCRTDEDVARLRHETGLSSIHRIVLSENQPKNRMVRLYQRLRVAFLDRKNYDLKIVLGGDDISEYYSKRGWLVYFPLMFLESLLIPTILLGQTIGPFTSYRRLLAKLTLNRTKIYTRDDRTLEYVESLGIRTALMGRDLAFLELPMQQQANVILEQYGLQEEDSYVTVIPSGLIQSYTSSYDHYLNEQHRIIRNLLGDDRLEGKSIVLLAHVRSEGASDRKVIEDLVTSFEPLERSRIVVVKDDILASEARAILGNGLFTVTGRMHAAISTFYMRKPAISLSYSVKYEGVIGDGLDLSDLIIEAADASLWKNGEISQMVAEKTNYVLNNYQELITKIDRNVSKTSQIVRIQLDSVVDDIRAFAEKSH